VYKHSKPRVKPAGNPLTSTLDKPLTYNELGAFLFYTPSAIITDIYPSTMP